MDRKNKISRAGQPLAHEDTFDDDSDFKDESDSLTLIQETPTNVRKRKAARDVDKKAPQSHPNTKSSLSRKKSQSSSLIVNAGKYLGRKILSPRRSFLIQSTASDCEKGSATFVTLPSSASHVIQTSIRGSKSFTLSNVRPVVGERLSQIQEMIDEVDGDFVASNLVPSLDVRTCNRHQTIEGYNHVPGTSSSLSRFV